ncbi:hypothetical protein [Aeromicrobium sp. IC_218]|uniref:hypothetical protein n=1 Tax=Aeromicrobium sp. IC_218 TaxID=2545468 RepID=UPI0010401043|nr:hypothetical protein [Aeromicrobium sp. IC_218]TCI99165.1 hypothetical protein E0W78_08160 [Aeromicrobium sp. IC_218]
MRVKPAALVLVSALALGGVAGVLVRSVQDDRPTGDARPAVSASSDPTASATPTPSTAPAAADPAVLSPGRAGPVEVGMSKDAALATGFLDADVPGADGCPDLPLVWKPALADTFDVQTLGNGEISSIGVRGTGPRTAAGLGVGSTAEEVRRVVDEDTAQEAGFGQSGLFDYDDQTGRWIGYLFDASPDRLRGSDVVSFVELTKGAQPGLVRSGC